MTARRRFVNFLGLPSFAPTSPHEATARDLLVVVVGLAALAAAAVLSLCSR